MSHPRLAQVGRARRDDRRRDHPPWVSGLDLGLGLVADVGHGCVAVGLARGDGALADEEEDRGDEEDGRDDDGDDDDEGGAFAFSARGIGGTALVAPGAGVGAPAAALVPRLRAGQAPVLALGRDRRARRAIPEIAAAR